MEKDFEEIAVFMDRALKIALQLQAKSGPKLRDFVNLLEGNEDIQQLRKVVNVFATSSPMPGFDPKEMKYGTL